MKLTIDIPEEVYQDAKNNRRYMPLYRFETVWNAIADGKPQEPIKGHWIEQIDHEENCRTLICSNCDRPALHDGDSIWKHKFCPHCGADMREVEE